jgi:hypothetical protein
MQANDLYIIFGSAHLFHNRSLIANEMSEVREEPDIGRICETPAVAKGIDAKFRIAELLDLEINCVNMFMNRVGINSYKSF